MKKFILFISIIVVINLKGFSQCAPDTSLWHGIYPSSELIPCIQTGVPFQTVLQIAFMGDSLNFVYFQITDFSIDSVKNLPQGLSYSTVGNSIATGGGYGCLFISGNTIAPPEQYDIDIFVSCTMHVAGIVTPMFGEITDVQFPWINIQTPSIFDTLEKPYLTVINPGAPCATSGGSNTNIISGEIFFDFNNNGVKDPTETVMANQLVTINPGPVQTYTNAAGEYHVFVDTGSYSISMNAPQNFTVSTSPSVYNINVTGPSQWITGNNFGLAPVVTFEMVRIDITANAARPGFITTHWINYQNTGTTLLSGTITYEHDPVLQFQNATVPFTTQSGNVLTWDYLNLNPGEQRTIKIYLQIPADNNLRGDTLVSNVSITPLSNVPHVNFTSDEVSQVVTGSYDPNDKHVSPDDLKNGVKPDQLLTYTIRFQNTGTDTAFTVMIRDTLDVNLDVSTFKTVAASHEVSFQLEGGKYAIWTFNNILLPDSNVNERESHGFVKFSILPKSSVAHLTMINNSASIYFDFNDPVQTNTATARIDFYSAIKEVSAGSLISSAYPNPSSTGFTILLNTMLEDFEVKIFDPIGNRVQEFADISGERIDIDLTNFQNGIFFYRIEKDSRVLSTGKLVVTK